VGSRSDNGGWPSDGSSPDDLPDFPEEWGVIVIPDDLSELADEVEVVRAELRRSAPQTRWQRFAARPAMRRVRRIATAAVRAPVLIISMAVLVTVASLFASAWPGPPRSPAVQRTADNTDEGSGTLPALEMIGQNGQTVPLRQHLPAVILITDRCDCAALVTATISAVSAGTAVITVTSGPASRSATANPPATGAAPQAQGKIVRVLRDPASELRTSLHLGEPDGTAAVLLIDHDGDIARTLPRTAAVADFQPYLASL
jgi:hypothetical protein